jgi:hypothetical protein
LSLLFRELILSVTTSAAQADACYPEDLEHGAVWAAEDSRGEVPGASLVVDRLDAVARSALGRVTSIVTAAELGDPDA